MRTFNRVLTLAQLPRRPGVSLLAPWLGQRLGQRRWIVRGPDRGPADRRGAGDESDSRHKPVKDRRRVVEDKVTRETNENERQGRGQKRSRVSFGSRAPCPPRPRDHEESCQEYERKSYRSHFEDDPFPLALGRRHHVAAAAEKHSRLVRC